MTLPEEGNDSYAIDIGLSALPPGMLLENSLWDFAVTGEYHRNTQINKEQDSLIISMSALGVLGDITTQPWSILPQTSLKYKNDEVKNTDSILISLDTSAVYLPLELGKIIGPDQLGFLWQPRIGLEYENIFEAKDEGPTGNIIRGYGFMDIALFPLRSELKERLELSIIAKAWYDVSKSTKLDNGDDTHNLIEYSVTYYFDENKHFALSLSHIDGENPTTGFQEQKFSQISLKTKF